MSCSKKKRIPVELLHTKLFFYASIPLPSIYNQSIPIYQSIGIDDQYQSITTRIFVIDWSSIININRLINIDWYRMISIVIDYRFHWSDTPGESQHANIAYKYYKLLTHLVYFNIKERRKKSPNASTRNHARLHKASKELKLGNLYQWFVKYTQQLLWT